MSEPSQSSDDFSDEDDDQFYKEFNDLSILKQIVKDLDQEKMSLKKIQQEFLGEWKKRENQMQEEFVNKEIFIKDMSTPIKNLLDFLQLKPQNENRTSWIIPATWNVEFVYQRYFFILDTTDDALNFDDFKFGNFSEVLFHLPKIMKLTNVSKCKECKIQCKSLKQHLNKAKDCKDQYSESDMNDMKEKLNEIAKANKKKLNATDYQRNKSELAQRYKQNKEEHNKRSAKYYEENKMKLKKKSQSNYKNRIKKRAETNAKYYLKNKEHLLAKAMNRKKNEEEDIKWSFMKDRETSLKTKVMEDAKKAKDFNSYMKMNFALTRGREIKLLEEIGIDLEIKKKLEQFGQRLDQIYDKFEMEIDEGVKFIHSKLEIHLENKLKIGKPNYEAHKTLLAAENAASKKFEELGCKPFSTNMIFNNYKNFFNTVDSELKIISDGLERPLSFSVECLGGNAILDGGRNHEEGEIFPGNCLQCAKASKIVKEH